MPPPITTRRATADDVETILGHVQSGFDSYTAFAPPGWVPPMARLDRLRTVQFLSQPDTWALLALVDGAPAGHVAFLPAREWSPPAHASGSPPPRAPRGLAHLWQLFVVPAWWGRGVAPLLHDRAIEEMRRRGFSSARLSTPSEHVRARRFYERRRWRAGEERWNDGLQLMLCEYRIGLEASRGPSPGG